MTSTITAAEPTSDDNYVVEGYAANFQRYQMYEYDGVKIYEQIDRNAFVGADMSDVIMLYDHEGKVYARSTNGSLVITVDDVGLKIRADLSGSEAARELHNEIKQGLITKMSISFTVAEDEFDRDTRTRYIKKIKTVYDVSAVGIPANDSTSIHARNLFNALNNDVSNEKRDAQHKRLKLKLKTII